MTNESDSLVPSVPVARPDPRLIQELFDTDPLDLTDQDLDLIIAEFRADRVNYLQEQAVGKKTAKAKAAAKSPAIPVSDQLDLSDLGLDL
jgi:hypothetical protein